MRWLIPSVLSLVLLCSCGSKPKTVIVEDKPFTAHVSIKCDGEKYEYNYSYQGMGISKLTPINSTPPFVFSQKDGISISSNNDIKYSIPNIDANPVPTLIMEAIDSSIGEELTADYNGEFKHYGSCRGGEYCLTVSQNAKIKTIEIKNINLKAEFI